MRRQAWWLQAAELGMVAGLSIWMVCTAVMLLGSSLVAWGPVTFLHRAGIAGLYLIVVLLAFTAPVWVIGGLMALISLGSREMWEQRAKNTEHGAAENSSRSVSDACKRGSTFRRGWSRRWNSFEQEVVNWFFFVLLCSSNTSKQGLVAIATYAGI